MSHRVSNSPGSLAPLLRRARSFRSDQGGSIIAIFAVCCVVLFSFVFIGVEYAGASRTDAALQGAADGGALAAAKVASGNSSATEADLQAFTEKFVKGLLEDWAADGLSVTLTKTASDITVKVCSNYRYRASFLTTNQLQQVCSTAVTSLEISTAAIPIDIHFVIDTSASMGLAADHAGRDLMKQKTKDNPTNLSLSHDDRGEHALVELWYRGIKYDFPKELEGCQFSCHTPTGRLWDPSIVAAVKSYLAANPNASSVNTSYLTGFFPISPYSYPTDTTETVASAFGIASRFDKMKAAADDVLNEADAAVNNGADIQFSLYAFHDKSEKLIGPTPKSSWGNIRQKLIDLQIGYPSKTRRAGVVTTAVLPGTDSARLSDIANDVGLYKRTTTRQQYFMLVTDGVNAQVHGSVNASTVYLFKQDHCNALKRIGTVAVLYLKYLEPEADDKVTMDILKTGTTYRPGDFYDKIKPNMEQCASDSSLFAMADDSTEIKSKMKSLFNGILGHANQNGPMRLTQ